MQPVGRRRRLISLLLVAAATGAAALVASRLGGSPLPARATVVSRAAAVPTPSSALSLTYGGRVFIGDPVGAPAQPPAATAGILVDLDTGVILWQHNPHERLAPASTTKIITALVALSNLSPSLAITVTRDALHQSGDETVMGLKAGETLTMRELLDGMLLVSGNDAATAIAADTVGVPRFVAAMNAEAAALGLHDSHFASPVGLDDPGTYSTPYDLAVLADAADRFPLFASTVDSRAITLPADGMHPEFDLENINLLLSTYPFATGVKPGYTGDAGYCEVATAVRDGHHLLSVLMNGTYVVAGTRRLLDWGFQELGLPTTLPTPSPSPPAHG